MILLWAYLDYLIYNYLGRYEIFVYVIFTYAVLNFVTDKGIVILKKHLVFLGIIFLSMLPFFYLYMLIRIGATGAESSLLESITEMIESEIRVPAYYESIERFAGIDSSLNFIMWIILLPIPSLLFPGKPIVTTSHIFPFLLTGRIFGQPGYSSILPSILGESFMIWGMKYFWIHGIVVGSVIGIYFKILEKYSSLTIVTIYYLLMIITIGRGGALSYLGTLINGNISIIVWLIITKNLKKKNGN